MHQLRNNYTTDVSKNWEQGLSKIERITQVQNHSHLYSVALSGSFLFFVTVAVTVTVTGVMMFFVKDDAVCDNVRILSRALTPQYAVRMRGSERKGKNLAALPFSTCSQMIRCDREMD